MILTTLVVLSEKLPLLSDSESGESMSRINNENMEAFEVAKLIKESFEL